MRALLFAATLSAIVQGVPQATFRSPYDLDQYVRRVVSDFAPQAEVSLRNLFGESYELPAVRVLPVPDDSHVPLTATYVSGDDEILIFSGSDIRPWETITALNGAKLSEGYIEKKIQDNIVHEAIHEYFDRQIRQVQNEFLLYGNASEDEATRKLWKTIIEGIAIVVTEPLTGFHKQWPDLREDDILLDMPIGDRNGDFYPYAAGRQLFARLYAEHGLDLLSAVAAVKPRPEEWGRLREYRERVVKQLADQASTGHAPRM